MVCISDHWASIAIVLNAEANLLYVASAFHILVRRLTVRVPEEQFLLDARRARRATCILEDLRLRIFSVTTSPQRSSRQHKTPTNVRRFHGCPISLSSRNAIHLSQFGNYSCASSLKQSGMSASSSNMTHISEYGSVRISFPTATDKKQVRETTAFIERPNVHPSQATPRLQS